jgi:acyl-CoA dehydrogenase
MSTDFRLTPEQEQVKGFIHGFCESILRPISLEADRNHRFPDELLARLGHLSSAAGPSSEAKDQIGTSTDRKKPSQSNRFAIVGAEELAWGDAAILLSLPGAGLGGPPVRLMGTPEQKDRFFGMLKRPGVRHGAYGLTEPGAGSDVSGIRTSCRKEGKSWVLNGRKCYITNGARADWTVIFATVDPAQGRAGHRAFVVEKGTPGFSVGKIEEKMGLRASETAELVLEDCHVPEENLLGGEEHYRGAEGFMGAMKTFDATRPYVGIMAVGIARAALDATTGFVKQNYMLGRALPRYAQLATLLAENTRLLSAARLMCWRAAWMMDEGLPNAKEASMAKAYAGKVAMKICADAVQILGAHGLERELLVEKWYRDVKVFDIFEGTAQIQRVVISKRILREPPKF